MEGLGFRFGALGFKGLGFMKGLGFRVTQVIPKPCLEQPIIPCKSSMNLDCFSCLDYLLMARLDKAG